MSNPIAKVIHELIRNYPLAAVITQHETLGVEANHVPLHLELDRGGFGRVEVKRYRCAQCGTALWYSADAYPNILALKPGTFDDTHWFRPIAHLWLRSAQPWVVLDEASSKYQKQPKMEELFALWAQRYSTDKKTKAWRVSPRAS